MDSARCLDTLPSEMVWCILEHTDAMTQIVCGCVNSAWRIMVEAMRNPQMRYSGNRKQCACRINQDDGTQGKCLQPRRCAIRYAKKALYQRRWSVFEWMVDRAGPMEGINNADKWACTIAAADGDLARLQTLASNEFRLDASGASHAAALGGHRGILEWLAQAGHTWGRKTLRNAIRGGHREMTEWATKRCAEMRTVSSHKPYAAARYGWMDVLEGAYAQSAGDGVTDQRWAQEAAKGGRVDVLEWLHEHKCDWDSEMVALAAARKGHLCVLQWITSHGCTLHRRAMSDAATRGHFEIVKWLWENGVRHDTQTACNFAANVGHLMMVQWLCERSPMNQTMVCQWAAAGGQVRVLEWCAMSGFEWSTKDIIAKAVGNGHINVLEWALTMLSTGTDGGQVPLPPVSNHAVAEAAARGHMETLRWIGARGTRASDNEWRAGGSTGAVRKGRIDILLWLRAHGYEWDETACMNVAASRGDLDMLEWLMRHGCAWNERACTDAAINGCNATVSWLRERGAPWNREMCALIARKSNWSASWMREML